MKHGAVILLGILDQPRILLGVKILILWNPTVTTGILRSLATKLHQLVDDFVLAGFRQSEAGGIGVGLGILPIVVETGIAMLGALGGFGIDLSEISKHRFD